MERRRAENAELAVGVKLTDSSGWPWAAAALALEDGEPVLEACSRAGLHRELTTRLTAPSGGVWVELLEGIEGAKVLVAEHAPGPAAVRIAAQAAAVGFADPPVPTSGGHCCRASRPGS